MCQKLFFFQKIGSCNRNGSFGAFLVNICCTHREGASHWCHLIIYSSQRSFDTLEFNFQKFGFMLREFQNIQQLALEATRIDVCEELKDKLFKQMGW